MTSEQHEERRAWWAIQSEKRALAQRIAEGSISYAHRVEVEEQIRQAEESYRDGLRGHIAELKHELWLIHTDETAIRGRVWRTEVIAELEARLSEVSR